MTDKDDKWTGLLNNKAGQSPMLNKTVTCMLFQCMRPRITPWCNKMCAQPYEMFELSVYSSLEMF